MKKGQFVIINNDGEVVRVLAWGSGVLQLIYRLDTRRVEAHKDVKELEAENVPFKLLGSYTKEQIKNSPAKIGQLGRLKWVPEVVKVAPTSELPKEDPEEFKKILKWSSLAHVSAVILILLISFILNSYFVEKKEEHIIKIARQQTPQKPVRTVKASRKKIKKVVKSRRKVVRNRKNNKRVQKIKYAKVSKNSVRRPKPNVNTMGALGALGGVQSGRRGGKGVNLNNAGKVNGAGFKSGKAGRGSGFSRVVPGKGLMASSVGNGSQVRINGKYNTRGEGGGYSGYGKMKIAGSSNGYGIPLNEEAFIEGGLERSQIDAVIKKNLGQVVYCYEKGLQVRPKLSGRVAVKFIIGSNGRVTIAKVSDTSLRSSKVEGCIVKRLKNWKFPRPAGNVNVKVTYPFVLRRMSQG